MSNPIINTSFAIGGIFHVECFNESGNLKWECDAPNGVPNAALEDLLNVYFRGVANPTDVVLQEGWALGLLVGGSAGLSVNDTHASHPGWTEFTNYKISGSKKIRPEWIPAAPVNKKLLAPFLVDFDITSSGTIGGVFLAGGTINGVNPTVLDADFKGGANAAPLLWATAILATGNAAVKSGDVLRVTYCVSAISA